jgi:hypothetical protein
MLPCSLRCLSAYLTTLPWLKLEELWLWLAAMHSAYSISSLDSGRCCCCLQEESIITAAIEAETAAARAAAADKAAVAGMAGSGRRWSQMPSSHSLMGNTYDVFDAEFGQVSRIMSASTCRQPGSVGTATVMNHKPLPLQLSAVWAMFYCLNVEA